MHVCTYAHVINASLLHDPQSQETFFAHDCNHPWHVFVRRASHAQSLMDRYLDEQAQQASNPPDFPRYFSCSRAFSSDRFRALFPLRSGISNIPATYLTLALRNYASRQALNNHRGKHTHTHTHTHTCAHKKKTHTYARAQAHTQRSKPTYSNLR
jgi:hypothetical protein